MNIILFLAFFHSAFGFESKDVIGHWKFTEMIYKGERIPLPNPELNLTWTYFKNGTERLFWDRGTKDFCERFSYFNVQAKEIFEETFFLNPRNASACAQDPDMQVGKKYKIKFNKVADELQFYFQLGDEELIYILRPVEIL